MREEQVFSKPVTRQVDRLKGEIRKAEDKIAKLKKRITELICTESPIKPGDTIYWMSGTAKRRGKVLAVYCDGWRAEYSYRCHILNKSGAAVGFATVTTDKHQPSKSPKE